MSKTIRIAIDGPAGAGKSTIAKYLSKKLGFVYIDTGAMYRATGLFMVRKKIALENENEVVASMDGVGIVLRHDGADGTQQIFLNGEDVSKQIRTEEVGKAASVISAYPQVRAKLTAQQQKLASEESVVMDGRDIGTVVLPEAELKIFLTASARARARRRFLELREKGVAAELSEIERDMEERDKCDSERSAAPLKQAEDAILLDSSDLTIDEVVERIEGLLQEKGLLAEKAAEA